MSDDQTFDKYDNINTTAVQWLFYNSRQRQVPLGIRCFHKEDLTSMWLLYIMTSFSATNHYEKFYLDCSWIDFLYVKYIRKIKQVKKARTNINAFMIDSHLFADEVCSSYDSLGIIVEDIYNEYWRSNK